MRSVKALLATITVAASAVAMSAPASADPVNATNGETILLECDSGLGTITVAVNGNGEWSPGLVTTNNQVGIPYAFHFEGSFTPIGGDTQSFSENVAKGKGVPRNGRLAVCTFHQEGEDEFGSFEVDGTVWISYTPAR